MIEVMTERLRLVAGTAQIVETEIRNRGRFADLIRAHVPDEWPPETVRDALEYFLGLYQTHPEVAGWLVWYGIRVDREVPVLCGSCGFKGPPDAAGMVEIGYSVLPNYQKSGVSTEMVAGLVGWASRQPRVRSIEAETTLDNLGSIRVLERNGFQHIASGPTPGSVRYRLIVEGPLTPA